jgi:hypothetical protein
LPDRVTGAGAKYYFEDDQLTPDTMTLHFDYGGKKGLIWEMRIWHDYGLEGIDNGVAVYGTDGFLHIGRWNRKWGFRLFDKGGKMVQEYQDSEPDFHMQSRKKPNCEIEIGHVSNSHCHLGNIVSRTGRNVRFDSTKETILNDSEANGMEEP